MGSIPPPVFSGQSKFASSFQQVLTRAVNIAALPLQQMQNKASKLSGEASALANLQSTFSSLETAIQNVNTAVPGAINATASNPALIQVTSSATTLPGAYSIEVDSIGSSTTTLSSGTLPKVTDPASQDISSSALFSLTINGASTPITPASNTLAGLANAINGAGAGVQATIVNLGSNSSPDYRLAVTGTRLAADVIQLTDDGNNSLLSNVSTGGPATYKLNGVDNTLETDTPQVTLAPGLTVNLLAASPGNPVTVTVAQNYSGIGNSLSRLATAYNAAVDALSAQRGQSAGALSGNSLIFSLGDALHSMVEYTGGSGAVASLADLGLNVDATGHLSFDATQFATQNTAAVQQFLGDLNSSGFLLAANSAVSATEDPSSGLIQGSIETLQDSMAKENSLIAQETNRINTLQTNLQKRLSDADAAIALLEQQVTYFTDLFAATYPNSSNKSGS